MILVSPVACTWIYEDLASQRYHVCNSLPVNRLEHAV